MFVLVTENRTPSFDRLEAGLGFLTQDRNDTIMKEHGTM